MRRHVRVSFQSSFFLFTCISIRNHCCAWMNWDCCDSPENTHDFRNFTLYIITLRVRKVLSKILNKNHLYRFNLFFKQISLPCIKVSKIVRVYKKIKLCVIVGRDDTVNDFERVWKGATRKLSLSVFLKIRSFDFKHKMRKENVWIYLFSLFLRMPSKAFWKS